MEWKATLVEDLIELAALRSIDRISLERGYHEFVKIPENSQTQFEEYIVSHIVDKEETYFLFENLNIAIRLLEDPGSQRIPRTRFIRYAPVLGLVDPFAVGKFFDHLDQDAKGYLTTGQFSELLTRLKKTFEPNAKWDDVRSRIGLGEEEVLLKHSSYVTNNTEDGIGPAGSLYLTPSYLYFESSALMKQKLIPLRSISSVNKKRSGIISKENVIEICGDLPNSKSLLFSFHRSRDRWYDYIKDAMEAQQMERDISFEAFKGFAHHNIHLSRSLYEVVGKNPSFLCTNSSNQSYRKSLIDGITNTSLMRLLQQYAKIPMTVNLRMSETPLKEETYRPFEYLDLVDAITTTQMYLAPVLELGSNIKDIIAWENSSTSILAILALLFLITIDVMSYWFYIIFFGNLAIIFWHPLQEFMLRLGMIHGTTSPSTESRRSVDESPQKRSRGLSAPVPVGTEKPKSIDNVDRRYTDCISIFSILIFVQSTTMTLNRFAGRIKSLYKWRDPHRSRVFLLTTTGLLLVIRLVPGHFLGYFLVVFLFLVSHLLSKESFARPYVDQLLVRWNEIPVTPATPAIH